MGGMPESKHFYRPESSTYSAPMKVSLVMTFRASVYSLVRTSENADLFC